MAWKGVITNVGNALLQQWTGGAVLSIVSAATGTGTVPEISMMAQTALNSQKQTASIVSYEQVTAGRKIKMQITAPNSGYTLNQFGVWAKIDNGAAVLLALFQNTDGIVVPSISESPDFAYTFYALLSFTNTGEMTVEIDPSSVVTLGTMQTAISQAAAMKQDKITASGLLKGDGAGGVTAAIAGTDFAYPAITGSGPPSTSTVGYTMQHYFDSVGKQEYICTGKSGASYLWKLAGATDASDLTYDGDNLADFLDGVSETLAGSVPLTGTTDPTTSTVGSVGQSYLNTNTMQNFYCTAADTAHGVYTWEKPKGGGVAPRLTVLVTTGSAVTCTDGATILTGTSVGGSCTFDLPDYGTWSVSATLSGQSTSTETVVVDQVKQYEITLTYFAATLTITAESGAVVTAVSGDHTYTGTCGSNGKCSLTVRYSGTYTISATKEGVTSSQTTKSVTTSGTTYTATVTFITLTVTVTSGSVVTATNGSTSKTLTSTGTAKFYLPNTGTWNVTASLSGETASGSVACSSYAGYSLELSYVRVFGVCWNYGSTSTALSRLTKANDPNGYVTNNIVTEPTPAVGTGSGSSPFDSFLPWSGMEEYNIVNNAVSYKKGTSSFNRSNDTVVFIPEYYFKIVDDTSNSKRYFYVADKAKTGFTKHPGSGKYVGRYNTASGHYTKTGQAPLVNITRATARSGASAKGSKWSLYDFASWCAVWLLYLIEFADWDSQTKIGRGIVDASSAASTGGTDSMSYHTGRASGTDGQTAVQYRGIENPWGNVYEWIDGINFTERRAWVCTNRANYADDTSTNYTDTGLTLPSSNGYIKKTGLSSNLPWSFIPTEQGGSETTYIPDYVSSNAGWRVLHVGGNYGGASNAGLFYFLGSDQSSGSNANIGARLLFNP